MHNRSRPCMLYQIKLCSAPCVGYVVKEVYEKQIELAEKFLQNKSNYVVEELTKLMDQASISLAYERAANYRDQIISIRKIQSEQIITKTKTGGNVDVIVLMNKESDTCINILFVRNGLVIGNKSYFPEAKDFISTKEEVLTAFIMHYYLQDKVDIVVPEKILLNIKLPECTQITTVFSKKFGRKVVIAGSVKGCEKKLVVMAEDNALNSLNIHQKSTINYTRGLLDFKNIFNLALLPQRIECFDVSHTMGESQVASCVVFTGNGPSKKDYRKFNIKTTCVGDDYGALREVLLRRYHDLKNIPDIIVVDGGRGQLSAAIQVLKMLQVNNILLMAIAKGKTRKPGLEEIYIQDRNEPLILSPKSAALHFMQQIRDEAHRFAISGHRKKMVKSRHKSELENILGIGKKKCILLLKHFGGMIELRSAGIDELAKVHGISNNLAKRIYEYLHA